MTYRMVSRRHAIFRPLSKSPDGIINWVLYDLNSANGTYLNGQRLQGSQELQPGDRIRLGHDGPEFLFEYQVNSPETAIKQGNPTPLQPVTSYPNSNSSLGDSVSFTQLFSNSFYRQRFN